MGQWPHRFKRTPGKATAKNPKARPLPGSMNKNEARYAAYLDGRTDVIAWHFECCTMRVGEVDGMQCTLKPDFKVVLQRNDMVTRIEWHEVKAYWKNQDRVHLEDDARVKLIAAASRYPEEQFCIVYFDSNLGMWREDRLDCARVSQASTSAPHPPPAPTSTTAPDPPLLPTPARLPRQPLSRH